MFDRFTDYMLRITGLIKYKLVILKMSDRLFQLDQQITQLRQRSQQNLSEAKTADTNLEPNRLYSLEQQLTSTQSNDPMTYANAYGLGRRRMRGYRNREESIDDEPMNFRRRTRGRRSSRW